MNDNKLKRHERLCKIAPALFASLALTLTVFFFAPFELFASNMEMLPFRLSDFFGILTAIALTIAAILTLLLIFLPKKAFYVFSSLITALALMAYVQSDFLTLEPANPVVNLIVWIVVLAVVITLSVLFSKKYGKIVRTVLTLLTVAIIGLQTIGFVTVATTTDGVFTENKGKDQFQKIGALTYHNLENVATDQNVIYFVIDRFSSSFVDTANKQCPEIFDGLDGFTYYDEMVSLYPRTFPAATYMLTGVENDFSKDRVDYFQYAWENSEFLSILQKQGYSINVYTDDYYAYDSTVPGGVPAFADNGAGKAETEVSDKVGLILNMSGLSLSHALPSVIKNTMGNITTDSLIRHVTTTYNDAEAFSANMKYAYNYLNEHPLKLDAGKKNFSFIHIDGAHLPNLYDRNFDYADENEKNSLADALIQSFKIIHLYMDQMKELGIYEDATIIIAGDHTSIGSDSEAPYYPHLTALFFKPSGVSEGELKVSSAPIAQEDLHATILESEGIEHSLDYGISIFDIPENMPRERRYFFQRYVPEDGMYENIRYKIVGSAKKLSNWIPIERTRIYKSVYQ